MHLFRKGREVLKGLQSYELNKLREYASKNGLTLEEALKEVVKKGIRYIDLEETYGKGVEDKDLWDKRYHFLKIESAYLHYRMLLREALDEMRSLLMTLSSVVSSLEICYNSLPDKGGQGWQYRAAEVEKLKKLVNIYMNKFVKPHEEELQRTHAEDEEVLQTIEDLMRKYKEAFRVGRKE